MACGKSQAHVDDLKLPLPGKLHGLGCIGKNGLSAGGSPKISFCKSRVSRAVFFGSSFIWHPFSFFR
jgi:hypothetical protein